MEEVLTIEGGKRSCRKRNNKFEKSKKVNEVSTVPRTCSSGKSGNDEEAVLSNFQKQIKPNLPNGSD